MRNIAIYSSSHEYGIGHKNRTVNWINKLREYKIDLEFEFENVDESTLFSCLKQKKLGKYKICIIDIDSRVLSRSIYDSNNQSMNLPDLNYIFFMTGQHDLDSEFSRIINPKFKIFPYGLRSVDSKIGLYKGLNFSIFSSELNKTRGIKKYDRDSTTQILISCGGSDPKECTLMFLNLLSEIKFENFSINLVIGPDFSSNLKNKINNYKSRFGSRLTFFNNIVDLSQLIMSSQLGLTTGGLTRNEFLYCGLPTIVLNIDYSQYKFSKSIQEENALISFGTIQDFTANYENAKKTLEIMISSFEDRHRLHINSRKLFDEKDAKLIIDDILNLWK